METRRPEYPLSDLALAQRVHAILAPGTTIPADRRIRNPMAEPEPEPEPQEGVTRVPLAPGVVLEEERVRRGAGLVLERTTIRGELPGAVYVIERAPTRTLSVDTSPERLAVLWRRLDLDDAFHRLHEGLGPSSPVAGAVVLERAFRVSPRMLAFPGDRGLGAARLVEKLAPEHVAGPVCAAVLEARTGQLDAALARILTAYGRIGRDPRLVLTEAMILTRRGAPDEALARLDELEPHAESLGRHVLAVARLEALVAAERFEEAASFAMALRESAAAAWREPDAVSASGATLLAGYLFERAGAPERAKELLAGVPPPRGPVQAALRAKSWRESSLATLLPHDWLQTIATGRPAPGRDTLERASSPRRGKKRRSRR